MLTVEEMEQIIDETMAALPPMFQERIENLMIAVEEWPDRETLRTLGIRDRAELLGFYHGIPLTERTTDYGLVAPDTISIYRRPILSASRTPDEARESNELSLDLLNRALKEKNLPEVNGSQLADKLRERWPKLRRSLTPYQRWLRSSSGRLRVVILAAGRAR